MTAARLQPGKLNACRTQKRGHQARTRARIDICLGSGIGFIIKPDVPRRVTRIDIRVAAIRALVSLEAVEPAHGRVQRPVVASVVSHY